MAGPRVMTHEDLINLLGQAMTDDDLRAKLLASPQDTLAAHGFQFDPSAKLFFQLLKDKKLDHPTGRLVAQHPPIKLAGDM